MMPQTITEHCLRGYKAREQRSVPLVETNVESFMWVHEHPKPHLCPSTSGSLKQPSVNPTIILNRNTAWEKNYESLRIYPKQRRGGGLSDDELEQKDKGGECVPPLPFQIIWTKFESGGHRVESKNLTEMFTKDFVKL